MKEVGLSFIIGAALGGAFQSTIGTAKTSVNSLGDSLSALGKTQNDMQGYQKMGASLESSRQRLVAAEAEVKRLTLAVRNTEQPSAKMLQDLGNAQKRLNLLKTSTLEQRKEFVKLGDSLKNAGVDTRNLTEEQKKLEKQMKQMKAFQDKKNALAADRQNLKGRGIAAIGTVMTMSVPVKLAYDLEDSMVEVNKNVKGLDTPEALVQMERAVRTIGKNSLLGVGGVAKLVAEGGKIGMAGDEALQYAAVAERMGVAFDLSADEAGASIAKIMSTMKLSLGEVEQLGDAINFMGDNSNSSADAITEMLKRNGGLIKSTTNMATAEIAALSAAFDAVSPSTEQASTAQKNFINALSKGYAATSAQQEALGKLGFNAEDLAAGMQTDAVGTIKTVMSALKDAAPEERSAIMTQLFGDAAVGDVASLAGNLEEFERIMSMAGDSTAYAGSMMGEYERKMGTSRAQNQLLRQNLEEIGLTIGKVLIPPLRVGVSILTTLIGWVGAASDKFPVLTSVVVGLGAAAMSAGVVIVGLGYASNIASTGMLYFRTHILLTGVTADGTTTRLGRLGAMMSWTNIKAMGAAVGMRMMTVGQWALNLAMSANPIGAFIVAIGALVGAAVWLYNTFEPFKNFADVYFGAWVTALKTVWGWLGKIGGAMLKVGKFLGFGSDEGDEEEPVPQVGDKVVPIGKGQEIKERKRKNEAELTEHLTSEDAKFMSEKMGGSFAEGSYGSQGGSTVTNEFHITYSPTLQIQGNASPSAVRSVLAEDKVELEQMLRRIMEERERVSNG